MLEALLRFPYPIYTPSKQCMLYAKINISERDMIGIGGNPLAARVSHSEGPSGTFIDLGCRAIWGIRRLVPRYYPRLKGLRSWDSD